MIGRSEIPVGLTELVAHEVVHHLQGILRLIERDHVTSIVNLQECKAFSMTAFASSIGWVVGSQPRSIRRCIELGVAWPVERQSPSFVSDPVANEVHITSVDQHASAVGQQIWDLGLEVLHPIVTEHSVHSEVTRGPGEIGRHAERGLDFGTVEECLDIAEVVAQRLDLARHSDVVNVQACSVIPSANQPLIGRC